MKMRADVRRSNSKINAKRSFVAAVSFCAVCLTGCGYSGFPLGPGTPPPVVPSDIGNWQIQAASTAGTLPFVSLAGWIYEPKNTTNAANVTAQSVFQAQVPSNCYLGATTLPSQGPLAGSALTLSGFSVNGQYLTINATQDATARQLSGTYRISGGACNGAAGTVTGLRYDPLASSYKGALASGQAFTLTTSQAQYPTGTGYFPISGTATTGLTCLPSASIDAATSYVIGNTVSLTLVANPLRLVLTGTLPTQDAATINITSVKVTAGQCADAFSQNGTFSRS